MTNIGDARKLPRICAFLQCSSGFGRSARSSNKHIRPFNFGDFPKNLDIDLERLHRTRDGAPHERLGRHMEDNLGIGFRNDRRDAFKIAYVDHHRGSVPRNLRHSIKIRIGFWRKGKPRNLRAHAGSHIAAHAPLKPVWPVRRTRRPDQNAGSIFVKPRLSTARARSAIALPSSFCRAAVSIACQKPAWR
jgi:hypothetical protein